MTAARALSVDLELSGGDEDLQAVLENASTALPLEDEADPEARGSFRIPFFGRGDDDGPEEPATPQDILAAAQADYGRMVAGLYSEGYFGGTVSILVDGREAASLPPLRPPADIDTVTIRVEAGPLFAFGETRIGPLARGTELPEEFARGETASVDVIRQTTSAATGAWRDQGHAKAEIADQQITARVPDRALDVSVAIDPGPQLTFGALTITGNRAVRTERIREIAGLPVGETFSDEALRRSALRLQRTGTFASAALIESDTIGPGNTLPITLQIAEQAPRRIGFGAEISSVDGLTLSGYWLHRNLLGGAERLRLEAEIADVSGTATGGQDYRFATIYGRPATFGPDTDLYIRGSIERLDEPEFLSDQIDIAIGATRIITDDLTAEAGIGLRIGRTEDDLGIRDYTLITFPLAGGWDRRDDPLNPTEGFFIDVAATPFVAVSGSASGALLSGDARYYLRPTASDRFVLAARGQIGSLLGPEIDQSPADYLFYSGGGGTVRGQEYQSLAIEFERDGEEIRTGGRSFLGAALEARVGVTENIALVGFYDWGQIGADSFPDAESDSHAGAGLGLRYNTGIGPIRLDIGVPVSTPEDQNDEDAASVQIYIGIGQAF